MEESPRSINGTSHPAKYYLPVRDGIIMLAGISWTLAYVFYVRRSYKDSSYGLPILSLCACVGWDITYGIFYPPAAAEYYSYFFCAVGSAAILYVTIKHGRKEWKHSPLIEKNFAFLLLLGSAFMAVFNWSFVAVFLPDVHQALFWSALCIQNLISYESIANLLVRTSTRGHSLKIWFPRFIGTIGGIASYHWRALYYPKEWVYVNFPLAWFLVTAAEVADLLYPLIYIYVRRLERKID